VKARLATAMENLLAEFRTLFRPDMLKRVWKEAQDDDVPGLAAEVAYYALFGLFPFLLFVASLIGLLVPDPEAAMGGLLALSRGFLPADTAELLAEFLGGTLRANRPDLLSVGILGTLWAGSQGFAAVLKALNRVYCVRETRGWLRHRALSFAMMVGSAFVTLALLVVMIGADPGGLLSRWLALSPQVVGLWALLRWPVAFVIFTVVLALLYSTVPCGHMRWRWITPGGLLASLLWILACAGLTAYIDHYGMYNNTYGAIGGVIILLTWIYVGSYLLLLGAEANAKVVRSVDELRRFTRRQADQGAASGTGSSRAAKSR
jgi:membrane protein